MRSIQTLQTDPVKIGLVEGEIPHPGEDQCLIKIQAAGLNRRDEWISKGLYPGIRSGVILGSDACGKVEEGPAEWKGKEVIINPNINWGPFEEAQSRQYTILGMPENGTLAEYLIVSSDRLVEKPSHLDALQASALPLAAMTAYRACFTQGKMVSGHRILITGAGGGVSQFAISFALALKCEVFVTSGKENKIKKCLAQGVKGGVNYKEENWVKKLNSFVKDGFDLIIDSAGGDSINEYIKLARPGGNIVIYGSTTGRPKSFDIFRLFWSQVSITGSTMASDKEFIEMVNFVTKHKIIPEIDKVFTIEDFRSAFDRFNHPDHMGKIVIRF